MTTSHDPQQRKSSEADCAQQGEEHETQTTPAIRMSSQEQILQLQRTLGNRAVIQLLRSSEGAVQRVKNGASGSGSGSMGSVKPQPSALKKPSPGAVTSATVSSADAIAAYLAQKAAAQNAGADGAAAPVVESASGSGSGSMGSIKPQPTAPKKPSPGAVTSDTVSSADAIAAYLAQKAAAQNAGADGAAARVVESASGSGSGSMGSVKPQPTALKKPSPGAVTPDTVSSADAIAAYLAQKAAAQNAGADGAAAPVVASASGSGSGSMGPLKPQPTALKKPSPGAVTPDTVSAADAIAAYLAQKAGAAGAASSVPLSAAGMDGAAAPKLVDSSKWATQCEEVMAGFNEGSTVKIEYGDHPVNQDSVIECLPPLTYKNTSWRQGRPPGGDPQIRVFVEVDARTRCRLKGGRGSVAISYGVSHHEYRASNNYWVYQLKDGKTFHHVSGGRIPPKG